MDHHLPTLKYACEMSNLPHSTLRFTNYQNTIPIHKQHIEEKINNIMCVYLFLANAAGACLCQLNFDVFVVKAH